MKTITNHNRTGKMVATVCLAMIFATGILAQPNPDAYSSSINESLKRIEAAMDRIEQALQYVAPTSDAMAEYASTRARLDAWASKVEKSLQYHVTSAEFAEMMATRERLEIWANNTEKLLCYQAPSIDAVEADAARERLEVFAANAENAIRYRIPDEEQVNEVAFAGNQETESETSEYLTVTDTETTNTN